MLITSIHLHFTSSSASCTVSVALDCLASTFSFVDHTLIPPTHPHPHLGRLEVEEGMGGAVAIKQLQRGGLHGTAGTAGRRIGRELHMAATAVVAVMVVGGHHRWVGGWGVGGHGAASGRSQLPPSTLIGAGLAALSPCFRMKVRLQHSSRHFPFPATAASDRQRKKNPKPQTQKEFMPRWCRWQGSALLTCSR